MKDEFVSKLKSNIRPSEDSLIAEHISRQHTNNKTQQPKQSVITKKKIISEISPTLPIHDADLVGRGIYGCIYKRFGFSTITVANYLDPPKENECHVLTIFAHVLVRIILLTSIDFVLAFLTKDSSAEVILKSFGFPSDKQILVKQLNATASLFIVPVSLICCCFIDTIL